MHILPRKLAQSTRATMTALSLLIGAFIITLAGTSARAASPYSVLHTFNAYDDGYTPSNMQLLLGSDGNYYGTTQAGGTNQGGTVFQLTPAGVLTTLHSFTNNTDGYNPQGKLAEDASGNLYGTTYYGGTSGSGTLYKIKTDGSNYATLHNFTRATSGTIDGGEPYGLIISGTTLYGITQYGGMNDQGTVYKMATNGTTDTVLHSFAAATDGNLPYYPLVLSGSTLYGVCNQGGVDGQGTLFSLTTAGASYTVLHSFGGSDDNIYGYQPQSIAINSSGVLYGNSYQGGADGDGEIWSYNTSSNKITAIYAFLNQKDGYGPAGLVALSGTTLYGSTNSGGVDANNQTALGVVYSVNLSNKTEKTLHAFLNNGSEGSGGDPGVSLGASGTVVGIRQSGGTINYGTIYSVSTSGTGFKLLFDFGSQGIYDGSTPYGTLVEGPDGRLHGTTSGSYIRGNGTLFSIGLGGTGYSIDDYADGQVVAGLVYDSTGDLYGATTNSGIYGGGVLFEVPSGDSYQDIFDFGEASGNNEQSAPIIGKNGYLYGTTIYGGQHNYGTIYQYDPVNMQETVLYSFTNGVDGSYPYGGVIQASDGNLYGTAADGGTNALGTVFKYALGTSTLTVLHSFMGQDGQTPYSGVIEGSNGTLYGTTARGGTYGEGDIYSISKAGTGYKPFYSFGAQSNSADGAYPSSPVAQLSNGKLYGTTTNGGASNDGVVYNVSITGQAYTVVHSFAGTNTDGAGPNGGVLEGSDGNLYGTTVNQGIEPFAATNVYGIIYEVASALPVINSFSPTSGVAGATVTINGANFGTVTGVSFNGTAATIVSKSATKVVVTVPAAATTGTITVTGTGYTTTSTAVFTITPPTITRFSPTSGLPGASVTITGTAFVGVSAVTFNGISATYTVNSATSITATVPTGTTTGKIAVTTPGGTAVSTTSFTVKAPTVTSFTPSSGPVGTSVTIKGTNFTGATSVTFNGTAARTFTVVSATEITATVPTGATTGKVAVTTPAGTGTSGATFTVN